ncbi:MAG: lactate utilization protein [Symbiobacteriaceae bacterium]|nr:lactate utilization protein [Symbiobacteriaceae bacterium]
MLSQVSAIYHKRAERTMIALERNRMKAHFVESRDLVVPLLKELIPSDASVSFGGSQTLDQCAVLTFLRGGSYRVIDRYTPGLTPEEVKQVQREAFSADYYLCSVNALSENGWLYAVDGGGNRVAAMIYGPDNVIIVAGVNKLVFDEDEAFLRLERLAAPANAMRLNLLTPCVHDGYCSNCNSEDRICCSYVSIGPQRQKGRITVILVGEELGY